MLAKNRGEEKIAQILAQRDGDYLLQRIGSPRFTGDGADSPTSGRASRLSKSTRTWLAAFGKSCTFQRQR